MTADLIALFAVAGGAFLLSLGFFLGTAWAAIHTSDEPAQRGADYDRAGRPLKGADLDRDRCRWIEHG
jgi:hypothetical protein